MYDYILVDGNALYFKSFYATYNTLKNSLKGSRSSKGIPINGIRTFANLIINLKKKYKNSKLIIAFDEQNCQSFRHKYDFYKANRKKAPDDLYVQIPLIKKFLTLYGVPWAANINYEADDLIGIFSTKLANNNIKTLIITTDRDLLQLINDNVTVALSKSGVSEMIFYDKLGFTTQYLGLKPNQFIDFKGIIGDPSDNLKGVVGVGEKTAIKLLCEFNNLENILENSSNLPKSIGEKFEKSKQFAILSKQLATIVTKSDKIDYSFLGKTLTPDIKKLREFLLDYEVYSVLNNLN